ncbi:DC1 domain-containing protein [Corchorus olitorius]|uniref:DC1 domain-containing protein n=1 Tax=Corchorus olitorius TaxID=93759 RepID=A0A1R3GSP7_9ROSI|nr:DC1 domain-containing protein [Corchorus olitorius]
MLLRSKWQNNFIWRFGDTLGPKMAKPKHLKHSPLRPCVNHFSHSHPLRPIDQIQAEDELICSGCGLEVTGRTFICSKSWCDFLVHKSCFDLEFELQHKSHPQHTLKLLSTPPHNYSRKIYFCNACRDYGTGFDYHCKICQYDLHVGCANLPKTLKHKDHQHLLTLYYSFTSIKDSIQSFVCDLCGQNVPNGIWVYYCEQCDFGIHSRCTIPDKY